MSYQRIGGTEVWHQTLLPRLRGVAGFVALEPTLATGDFSKLDCPTAVGIDAAKQLAASVDVLVVWGIGDRLLEVLSQSRPNVISVSHCDARSEWTIQMMAAQKSWTDHAVYLCPTGLQTIPPGVDSTYIPNAPDPARIAGTTRHQERSRLGLASTDRLLISVSRLSPEKQVAKLIRAVDYLPHNYKLAIAGTSSGWSHKHADELRAIAGPRVQFLGNIDPPGGLLSAADAFLSASEYEGYGLSMAEAVLSGLPVIATAVGLLETSPQFARLVDHDATPQGWAESIERDFADPFEQRRRAAAARRQVDTVEQFAAAWESLIHRISNQ